MAGGTGWKEDDVATRPPRQSPSRQSPSRARQSQAGRARPGRPQSRTPRPLPRGDTVFTPGAGGTRRALERSSARPLGFMYQLPRWLPPAALLALLIAGLALPGWPGGAALVLVAAFLGWLAYVSWPALGGRGRVLRLAAVACVLAFAVVQTLR